MVHYDISLSYWIIRNSQLGAQSVYPCPSHTLRIFFWVCLEDSCHDQLVDISQQELLHKIYSREVLFLWNRRQTCLFKKYFFNNKNSPQNSRKSKLSNSMLIRYDSDFCNFFGENFFLTIWTIGLQKVSFQNFLINLDWQEKL